MTASDRAISDHVVVQCPACGACESVETGADGERPDMVCRECGETWPATGSASAPADELADAPISAVERPRKRALKRVRLRKPAPPVLVAERRPLVTYSDRADTTWKAKIEGDYWPEPPRPRRLPMVAAAVAALFFLAAFFGAREAAVAALPDLAGLYAAIGMPVNLDKLAIENVSAERVRTFEGSRVSVRATIRNVGRAASAIPDLVAVVGDRGARLGVYRFDPPAGKVGAGHFASLSLDLGGVKEEATSVTLRFLRPGETLASTGTAQLTVE